MLVQTTAFITQEVRLKSPFILYDKASKYQEMSMERDEQRLLSRIAGQVAVTCQSRILGCHSQSPRTLHKLNP